MKLSEALKKEAEIWMNDYELSTVKEINNGFCADFAEFFKNTYNTDFELDYVDISEKDDIVFINNEYNLNIDSSQFFYRNVFQLHHTLLYSGNKFYDAENPNGVTSPIELAMVQRVLSEIQELITRDEMKKNSYKIQTPLDALVKNHEEFLKSTPSTEEAKELIKEYQQEPKNKLIKNK